MSEHKLANDIFLCHDDGCGEHETCLRWLVRDNGGERTSHCQSLFPNDIPLGSPGQQF